MAQENEKPSTVVKEIRKEVKEVHLHSNTHLDEAENMFCPMCIEKTISLTAESIFAELRIKLLSDGIYLGCNECYLKWHTKPSFECPHICHKPNQIIEELKSKYLGDGKNEFRC